MQRYRINYYLLGAIFLACVLLPPPLYFFWKSQVDSNATWFHKRAEAAMDEGDIRSAAKDFRNYVKLRPEESDARVRLANVLFDISETVDVTRDEIFTAYAVVEDTVTRTGDPELRRKLIDLQMKFQRAHDAIGHIEELLLTQPEDHELKALRAKCLFISKDFIEGVKYSLDLIGYDKKSDAFDSEKAQVEDQPEVYADLARILYGTEKKPELAERVIQRMIDQNPESHVAYLRQSVFLNQIGEKEASTEALERAFELDPTDIEVLLRKGIRAFDAKQYEEASQIFAEGAKRYPDRVLFHLRHAQSEAIQERFEEGIKVIDEGIAFFGMERAISLQMLKVKILFTQKKFSEVEKELKELAGLNNPNISPLVEFERARVIAAQGDWVNAAKAMKKVRPKLHAHRIEQSHAGNILAECYQRLGKRDLAVKFYKSVLRDQPENPRALAALERLERWRSQDDPNSVAELDVLVRKTLEQPEDQQDWDAVTAMVNKQCEKAELSEARRKLLYANVMVQRKKFSEARKLVTESFRLDPDDLHVVLAAIRLIQVEPEPNGGPLVAMKLLDKKSAEMGDKIEFRALRAGLLFAIGGDQVPQQLWALTEGMEDWNEKQQAQMWSSIGTKFQQLKLPKDAQECWSRAAALLPNNLPVQLRLFELALAQGDNEAMQAAQKRILAVVDESDSNYILTEVKRLLVGHSQGDVPKEEILKARGMLDTALAGRPDWHELHVLYGQLLLVLGEDTELTLKHFEDALKLGPPNLNAVALQIRLLASKSRFSEAEKLLELIPAATRNRTLGRIEATILMKAGKGEEGYEVAQRFASEQPGDAKTQVWFSEIALAQGKMRESEAALRLAITANPSEPQHWIRLVSLFLKEKNGRSVEKTLREAHLSLDAEYLPLLTAKYYELGGRWQDAERLYLTAYESKIEEVSTARRMASFYLLWVKEDPTNRQKAAPYINHILRAANEGRVAKDQADVVWARRQGARLLATSKNYQDSLDARKLLEEGAVDGKLRAEDRLLASEIHMSQRDPKSRLEAINLLASLLADQQLDKAGELRLARLMHGVGQWNRCETHMLDMLARYGADPGIWATYMDMLIDRGEYKQAAQRLSRLESMQPKGVPLIRLKARLASAEGDKALLRSTLQKLLPANLRTLEKSTIGNLVKVASLAAELDDQDLALQLYRLYVQAVPEHNRLLVEYLATYGDCDEVIDAIKRLGDRRTDDDLQIGLNIIRSRRKDFGDKYDEEVLRLLRSALREDPDSGRRRLMLAEALETTGNFDECTSAYEELLQRSDIRESVKAAAMNNLAFVFALQQLRLDEAAQFVEQSMEVFGPIAEVLDTRALVRMAQEKYDLAVQDMELAVVINPTATKYFHLAKAQILAGNSQAALEAWEQAEKLGLLVDEPIHPLDQQSLEELSGQIEGVRAQGTGL